MLMSALESRLLNGRKPRNKFISFLIEISLKFIGSDCQIVRIGAPFTNMV